MMRAWLTALATACATATANSPPTSTAPATASPAYGPQARVGIEMVDRVILAVLSGDAQAVRDLIHYTAAPCAHAEGLGGPPKCRPGEPEGTVLEVLPFLGPEGSYIRREEIASWPGLEASALYAVYRVSERVYADESNPAGEFAAAFVGQSPGADFTVHVDAGGIVRIDYSFGTSLGEVVGRDAAEFLLPPPSGPP